MNKRLLILGAGQYGLVAGEIAESMGCFETISYLDDNVEFAIGKMSEYNKYTDEYNSAIVAIDNPQVRMDYINKLKYKFEIPTLVHPAAYISPSATIGVGCIVEPMAVIHANTVVSDGCIISSGSIVNHNSVLQEGCHIDCGAVVAARAVVPGYTKVCSRMVFSE